jgi:hypothetical protein
MDGNSAHGVGGIPKSSNFFNKMMRIPDEHIICWLQEVIEGTIDLAMFKVKCHHYKLMEKLWEGVTTDLREYIEPPTNQARLLDDPERLSTWQQNLPPELARKKIEKQFPSLVKLMEDRATGWSKGNLKDVCSGHIMAQFKAHMAAQVKAREEQGEPEPEPSQPVRDSSKMHPVTPASLSTSTLGGY